jgi:replication initiation and membrane attachment protein
MSTYWTTLLPGDRYVVHRRETLSIAQIGFLLHFYQPIIGSSALSLYLTLAQEISTDQVGVSRPDTHRWLLTASQLPLNQWLEARYILEGVGLIQTRKYNDPAVEETIYGYKVCHPLNPAEFIQSDILSTMLLNRIGKYKYRELRDRYISNSNDLTQQHLSMEDVTKSFDEVFRVLSPSELRIEKGSEQEKVLLETEAIFSQEDTVDHGTSVRIPNTIDSSLLKSLISPVFKPHQTITSDLISLFSEMGYLYQLDEMQLAHFIENPEIYDETGKLDPLQLNKTIKEWYRKNHYGKLPDVSIQSKKSVTNSNSKQTPDLKQLNKDSPSEEGDHIQRLERMSPLRLMEAYQQGSKIPDADIDLVESLVTEYQLPHPVINVLIEYVMLTQQYKLPRALVEKIAGHWKRMKLDTAYEALELAKKEHQIYKQWNSKARSSVTANKDRAKPAKKDKLPKWVEEQLVKEKENVPASMNKAGNPKQHDSIDKEQRALELLRALGELK